MRRTPGWTLVEVLLSAAILGVLGALILPALQAARAQAARATCSQHLKQIGLAFRLYQADYGELPNPVEWAGSVPDRRALVCPADVGDRPARSSYAFRTDLPPDYRPYWERTQLEDTIVIAACSNHLDRPRKRDGSIATEAEPRYPYRLVLRAGGEVEPVTLSRIHEVLLKRGDRPVVARIYPGEPWYERAGGNQWTNR